MSLRTNDEARLPRALLLLIAVQVVCAAFFIGDVVSDWRTMGWEAIEWHLSLEIAATLSLCLVIAFEIPFLMRLMRRKAHLERNVSLAQAAMHDVVEAHFAGWGLTPTEADVAMFVVKGLGIAEIAELRGSAEGTVKSHLNAIYRKSGTRGRGELLSLILDSLFDGGRTADIREPAAKPRRLQPMS